MFPVYCVLSLPPMGLFPAPKLLLLLLAQLQRVKPRCFVILNRRNEHWNLGSASTFYLQELAVHTVPEARRYYDFNLTVKLQYVIFINMLWLINVCFSDPG